MSSKKKASEKGDSPMRLRRSFFSQLDGKVKEGKIDHDTGQDVKEDVCDVVT
jgi:hypothetical protein